MWSNSFDLWSHYLKQQLKMELWKVGAACVISRIFKFNLLASKVSPPKALKGRDSQALDQWDAVDKSPLGVVAPARAAPSPLLSCAPDYACAAGTNLSKLPGVLLRLGQCLDRLASFSALWNVLITELDSSA